MRHHPRHGYALGDPSPRARRAFVAAHDRLLDPPDETSTHPNTCMCDRCETAALNRMDEEERDNEY